MTTASKTAKLAGLLMVLGIAGCQDAPLNGVVRVHITDAGVVASCESLDTMNGGNIPTTCSAIYVSDERTKGSIATDSINYGKGAGK